MDFDSGCAQVDELDFPESLDWCGSGESDDGTDPREHNWLQWEEDGEAAKAYVQLNIYSQEILLAE